MKKLIGKLMFEDKIKDIGKFNFQTMLIDNRVKLMK